jgi:adenosylhomocysteine nucleosidase
VGAAKAARKVEDWSGSPSPDVLIICGYAAGLADGTAPGALVIADAVVDPDGGRHLPDAGLLAAASSIHLPGFPVSRGILSTGDAVLVTIGEKRALALRTGAIAVDMETAGAARAAERRGLRWLAVRAVTDGPDENMPFDFNTLADREGNVDRRRVVLATLIRPWKIPGLVRLGAGSMKAARNLACFLETLLRTLPE